VKLRRVAIKNFKLLRDAELRFSTDARYPLTVIRAENGSGKTSLLYALLWAFYGISGLPLPGSSGDLRLSSTDWPPREPCEISVRVEFESTEYETYAGEEHETITTYVLTRTVIETPAEGNTVTRQRDSLIVHAQSDQGADRLEDAAARALIRRLAPEEMKNIFFTDGDRVQRFITGELGAKARQSEVHNAVRALLGLDSLRTAEGDLEHSRATFRRRLAAAPGAKALEEIESRIESSSARRKQLLDLEITVRERLANITDAIDKREARLYELKDLGEIEKIRKQSNTAKETLATAEVQLNTQKRAQRDLMKSEALSWVFIAETMEKGLGVLQELADRNVIPGTSVEVLRDRLELGMCICGEELGEDSTRREAVQALLTEQLRVDPSRQRLTAMLHSSRLLHEQHQQQQLDGKGWIAQLDEIETVRAGVEKQIRDQTEALKECEESLRRLEDADIDRLLDALSRDRVKRDEFVAQLRETELRLSECQAELAQHEERYQAAKAQVKVSADLQDRIDVSEDLLRLVQRTLETLEGEYLGQASDRMNDLFMRIVGSTPEVPRAVFNEVRITPSYDIEVLSGGYGRTLDPDFEINGASKRALTLSFIWALMEVADVSAPRIIDTPLGMTSGGVKQRFVDLLTMPTEHEFQIILLMTRSEITGVEELINARAGVVETLSCSHQYPVDLVNNWGGDVPEVRVCECTHLQSCNVCARHDDHSHQLSYREAAAKEENPSAG
jgi:DNA sulfur modification protein DndD